ncbi:MAG TPA: GspMb/PilO family protein [Terriglobales bacterium]
MADLQHSRRKLKIGIALLVAVDVLAAVVLFSPLVGSAKSRRFQMFQLSAELRKKTHDVEPLRGMDKKVALAKTQIPQFYSDRFAAQDSDIAQELGKLAAESGVKIQQAKYKQEDAESSGVVVPVEIEGTFSGAYLQLVRFINSLERSKLFITVDSVDLAGEAAGPVKLQVKMHSYLRSGA